MAAAPYYHGEPSPPQKHSITTEMYNLPSPDPSYNRPSQPQEELLNPSGHAPSTIVPQSSHEPKQFSRLLYRKFERFDQWLRMLTAVSGAVSTLLSVIMFGIMLYVNITFMTTKGTNRDVTTQGTTVSRNPWPLHGTKLWPAIMLLVASGVTLVISVVILCSYCCCRSRYERSWKLTIAKYVVHILAWAIVAVVYRYEKGLHGNNNDLWGWSCSTKAKDIQVAFNGVVDFSKLCTLQTNSWHTSIAEFAAKTIFAIVHFIIFRKRVEEKKNLADSMGDATTGLVTDMF